MKNKDKSFLKPRKGEVDPAEKRRLIDESHERRRSATHHFYWMSLEAAKDRWKNGRGIPSGLFDGVRLAYTNVTFFKVPPPYAGYDDFKLVGSARIGENIQMFSGITAEMFSRGELIARRKDDVSHQPADPMDAMIPHGMRKVTGEAAGITSEGTFEDDE